MSEQPFRGVNWPPPGWTSAEASPADQQAADRDPVRLIQDHREALLSQPGAPRPASRKRTIIGAIMATVTLLLVLTAIGAAVGGTPEDQTSQAAAASASAPEETDANFEVIERSSSCVFDQ